VNFVIMAAAESTTGVPFGIDKLKGRENYSNWSFAMTNYLRRNGLWASVQCTDTAADKERHDERAL